MTEISFYHLQYSSAPTAVVRLVQKAADRKLPTLLLCQNEDMVKEVDELLWTFSTDAFIPHATDQDALTDQQPVLISSHHELPANHAELLVIQGRTAALDEAYLKHFNKVMDVFDGSNDNDVAEARKRWAHYKKQGYTMTYWKQNQKGGWQQG